MGADSEMDDDQHNSPPPSRPSEAREGNKGLRRDFSRRHLTMLAIGGTIGPGYFIGMGTGLSTAGPAGLLICFAVVGILLWTVTQSLGEMGAFISVSGSFTHYTSRFLDPALGFALGWNYFFLWCGVIIANYSMENATTTKSSGIMIFLDNLGLVLGFWESSMPSWGWILVFWFLFLGFALLGVRVFGEAEFWFTLAKILALTAFFLCSILISTGIIGSKKIGFKYYRDPGPFRSIEGVFQTFVFAALQYSGTEMVGLSAGESNDPSRDVPKAVKNILIWRIIGIFLGGVFFINLAVPWNDLNLLHAGSKTASSPFVIAFTRVGINVGAHVVNAIILITLFSALNGTLYVGSRTLYGLAQEGAAPRIFLYTTNKGVPIVALATINIMGFLSLLNLSSGAGTIYTWIVSMIGLATFITWCLISLCHIRLRYAMALQNLPISVLPFQAAFWPYGAYLGFGGSLFFIIFQGWTSFVPWNTSAFFMNYISIMLFILLAMGWKVWHKTKWVNLEKADLVHGRRDLLM